MRQSKFNMHGLSKKYSNLSDIGCPASIFLAFTELQNVPTEKIGLLNLTVLNTHALKAPMPAGQHYFFLANKRHVLTKRVGFPLFRALTV